MSFSSFYLALWWAFCITGYEQSFPQIAGLYSRAESLAVFSSGINVLLIQQTTVDLGYKEINAPWFKLCYNQSFITDKVNKKRL